MSGRRKSSKASPSSRRMMANETANCLIASVGERVQGDHHADASGASAAPPSPAPTREAGTPGDTPRTRRTAPSTAQASSQTVSISIVCPSRPLPQLDRCDDASSPVRSARSYGMPVRPHRMHICRFEAAGLRQKPMPESFPCGTSRRISRSPMTTTPCLKALYQRLVRCRALRSASRHEDVLDVAEHASRKDTNSLVRPCR